MVKKIFILFAIFILFQDLIVLNVGANNPVGIILKHLDEYFILCIFIVTIGTHFLKRKAFYISFKEIAFLVFIASGVMSSLLNKVDVQVAMEGCFLAIKGFLLYYAVSLCGFSDEEAKSMIKFFIILGILFLIAAIVDIIIPVKFRLAIGNISREIEYRGNVASALSFFVISSAFSWWMAYNFILALAAFRIYKKQLFLLLIVAFFVGVVISFRMKPILAILSVMAYYLTIRIYERGMARFKNALVFIGIALITVFLLQKPISDTVSYFYNTYISPPDYASVPRRLLYYTSAQIAVDKFPFGVGFGRFGSFISVKYYSDIYYQYGLHIISGMSEDEVKFIMDTFWPMIFGETGMLGGMAYIIVFIGIFVQIRKRLVTADSPLVKFICLSALLIFFEALVESIAAPMFVRSPQMYFVFFMLGLASQKCNLKKC